VTYSLLLLALLDLKLTYSQTRMAELLYFLKQPLADNNLTDGWIFNTKIMLHNEVQY